MRTNHVRVATLALLGLALPACHADRVVAVNGRMSRTLSTQVGSEVDITLGTVGPGEYASPPSVSSPSVRFVSVSYVSPAVPAGPTQLFRFEAVSKGRAVIVFRHTDDDPVVQDTIDVR
ncbi:MAG TPA: hypothetical protein VF041_00180 [Gemmatimonadaceae bacterium]